MIFSEGNIFSFLPSVIISIGYSFKNDSDLITYYCAHRSDTHPTLGNVISSETIKSTLWTLDLDLTNKASCEYANDPETQTNAGFIWTGKDFYHIIGNDVLKIVLCLIRL